MFKNSNTFHQSSPVTFCLESPFRLGKVQAKDLQVSVREVGVVDPVAVDDGGRGRA
ncbi:MAG TPA: hypothetical protein VKK31_28000 [Thermoanaerobaculia bacterium]|nr:hypothetical protein [Thermoanaerobaculia bacterium]